jgi:hypothetical protein
MTWKLKQEQPDPAYNVGDLVKIKPDAFRYFSGRMGIVVQRLGFMYSQDEDEWTMAMYLVSIAVDGDKKFASHVFREDEIDLVSTQIGRRR